MLQFEDYRQILLEKINKLYGISKNDVVNNGAYGDFTFKIFRIKEEPQKILESIQKTVKDDFIEKIELKENYINFYIKPSSMAKTVSDSIARFGIYPNTFQDTSKALIEHTSSNPTGPIHVGRIRNSIIGDSIFRIVERYGTRSCTQYFVNDSGKQVISLYLGHVKYHSGDEMTVSNLLDGYQKIYDNISKDPEIGREVQKLDEQYENGDRELISKIQKTASIVLDSIKDTLAKLDIKISTYVWESNFLIYGDVEKMLNSLSDELLIEGNAKYVRVGDRKIFLTREDGTSLYFARDLVYHEFKAENFDWIIDVLGEDHKEHAKNLNFVLKNYMDFQPKIDFVFYGFVSLESGKMSTRKGNIITVNDLYDRALEESRAIIKIKRPGYAEDLVNDISSAVATSSIRYNIVKINANKPVTFRWSEALNFEGDSAPFIMYAYARASSILEKTDEQGELSDDYDEYEKALIKAIYMYPYYIQDAKEFLRADIIAGYLLYLVKSFNEFYLNCPILNSEYIKKRIKLLRLFKITMEDSCSLIGIKLLNQI
ncbi:MAG: arginine--tRNA ligase [Ferroplasma sp.]